jgi:hypothetical protein
MKNLYVGLLTCFVTLSLQAQEIAGSFLDKYGKDENIEVITIGKKMLDLMQHSDSIAGPELKEAIAGVESIIIISSQDKSLNEDYYNAAFSLLTKNKNFAELLSINKKEEVLLVMIKETKGIVSELVLLSNRPGKFDLISLSGDIKLDRIAQYSKNLDLDELRKWNIMENEN